MQSNKHNNALRQLKLRLQLTLTRLRTKQRTQQRKIEQELANNPENNEKEDAEGEAKDQEKSEEGENEDCGEGDAQTAGGSGKKNAPIYCRVCKLLFHQKRSEHNKTEMHKLISKFLNPQCTICNTQFFSPMAYERHIGSIGHIKKRTK